MAQPPERTYGRAAMLGVLLALLLIISAAVYVYISRWGPDSLGIEGLPGDPGAEALRLQRKIVLLTILLISSLLILLFVIGSYLLIQIGKYVRRPISGTPTQYVDAWQQYRLTDEQIAAATAESPDENGGGAPPSLPPERGGPRPPPDRKD